MCETIPKLRDSIKEASMSDLKDFLENIRKHSDRIGEIAMKHVSFSCVNELLLTSRKTIGSESIFGTKNTGFYSETNCNFRVFVLGNPKCSLCEV